MNIPIGEWFRLPFMGKDVFIRLRAADLKYDSKKGFMVTSATKMDAMSSILRDALSEDVEFSLKCFVCGTSAPCNTCIYNHVCDRSIVSSACICDNCKDTDDAYALYSMGFVALLE